MGDLECSLQNIVDQKSLRWIFVGGKGGVGKTTVSTSLATELCKTRKSVLIISTDPAHNLGDAFNAQVGSDPTPVPGQSNLFAMEIDPNKYVQRADVLGGQDESVKKILRTLPGADELMGFYELLRFVSKFEYEVIVFDTAPTGHTLRFLSFPEMFLGLMEKFQSFRNRFAGLLDSAMSMAGGLPDGMSAADAFEMINKMRDLVEDVSAQFRNPDLSTFVCVCIPEFLSIYETERLVQELMTREIDVHNVVVNQILDAREFGKSPLLDALIAKQQRNIEQIRELYEDFHVAFVPMLVTDVRGVDQLEQFAQRYIQCSDVILQDRDGK